MRTWLMTLTGACLLFGIAGHVSADPLYWQPSCIQRPSFAPPQPCGSGSYREHWSMDGDEGWREYRRDQFGESYREVGTMDGDEWERDWRRDGFGESYHERGQMDGDRWERDFRRRDSEECWPDCDRGRQRSGLRVLIDVLAGCRQRSR